MPYSNNVPQAAQTIASSQNQILQNFITIQQWTNVDHVEITGAGGNEGKHAKVSLIQQPYVAGGNFAPAIDPNNGRGTLGIYAALNAANDPTSQSRMWAVIPIKDSNTTWVAANIPFTESSLLNIFQMGSVSGYSYLPSGLIIKFGQLSTNIANTNITTANFTFSAATGGAFPNKCIVVLLSSIVTNNPDDCAALCNATALATTGFTGVFRSVTVNSTTQPRVFSFIAIGY